jgi:hypothetical protein
MGSIDGCCDAAAFCERRKVHSRACVDRQGSLISIEHALYNASRPWTWRAVEAFNYLTVMVSIVVGLGLTQLLAGIGNFVQIRRRVRFYWLHTAWVLLLIVLHLHMWWSFWVLREVTDWTYGTFAYVLIGPALLVIASHVIIPELIGERIDVERHYYDTHTIFFGMIAATGVWAMFLEPVTGVRTFVVPFRILQAFGTAMLVALSISKHKRFHAVATVLVAVMITVAITLTRFRLGQLDLRL